MELISFYVFTGYIPNCSEAVIAMLAAASLGAVWSSSHFMYLQAICQIVQHDSPHLMYLQAIYQIVLRQL